MIKINLVREGRAVRGGGGPVPAAVSAGPSGGSNINNVLILLFLILGALAAGGYWYWKKAQRDERQATVELRRGEAQKLEGIIKEVEDYQRRKENLQKRIDLINQLKQNQKGPVRIMDQVSKDLPDLVWLDSMRIASGRVTVNGRGLNPNAIANFVENVKNDTYFEEPIVNDVVQVGGAPVVYSFSMNFAFTYQPKNLAATGDATATGTTGSGTATTTGSTAGK